MKKCIYYTKYSEAEICLVQSPDPLIGEAARLMEAGDGGSKKTYLEEINRRDWSQHVMDINGLDGEKPTVGSMKYLVLLMTYSRNSKHSGYKLQSSWQEKQLTGIKYPKHSAEGN